MKIISIDTGDPKVSLSKTAIVKIIFLEKDKIRTAITYSGTFKDRTKDILEFIGDADYLVIEQIDATNKFLSRDVVAEQIGLKMFLDRHYPKKVTELIRSGRKEIITDALLKQIEMFSEGDHATHHHDVREATRNLLYFMAKSQELNLILSNYVQCFFK